MLLTPDTIFDHQDEEKEESKQVCPNINSLIVKLEDASEAIKIVHPLPVSRQNRDLLNERVN